MVSKCNAGKSLVPESPGLQINTVWDIAPVNMRNRCDSRDSEEEYSPSNLKNRHVIQTSRTDMSSLVQRRHGSPKAWKGWSDDSSPDSILQNRLITSPVLTFSSPHSPSVKRMMLIDLHPGAASTAQAKPVDMGWRLDTDARRRALLRDGPSDLTE